MAESFASDWRVGVAAVTFLIGIFGVLFFVALKMAGGEEAKPPPRQEKEKKEKKRGAMDRMQRGASRAAAAGPTGDGEEDEEDEDGDDGTTGGARNAQKDQKKQERKAQQQAERDRRQEQERAKSERNSKYSQKQQEKEAERQKKEDEEKKAREEKEKQEKAEFDSWKQMFAVDAEGEDESNGNDGSAVERFIDYVKMRKVVNLEDIAAEFRMRTSAAIDRLDQLEKLGRLSGIFDDRGKFVYITTEEMAGVSDWLKKKGRISRADLVAACNRIIRLNPTDEDKAKLQEEARTAAAALEEGGAEGEESGAGGGS